MSLHILYAHTGSSFSLNPQTFRSLDELKQWISQETSIEPSQQILMTSRGKQFKTQNLSPEEDVFLYDRRLLTPSTLKIRPWALSTPNFTPSTPEAPPTSLSQDATLLSWQNLFAKRRDWAFRLTSSAERTVEGIINHERERSIMEQGTAIAVSNVKQRSTNLKRKFDETSNWAVHILDDQAHLLKRWTITNEKYRGLKANADIGNCLQVNAGNGRIEDWVNKDASLADFVDLSDVRQAATQAGEKHRQFSDQVDNLKLTYLDADEKVAKLLDDFQSSNSMTNGDVTNRADQLMEEIEVLSKKIDADCQTIQALQETPKSLTQASKTANLHDNTFMTSLVQTSEDMKALFVQVLDLRDKISQSSLQYLHQISSVELGISAVHHNLASLDVDEDCSRSFEKLNTAVRLPFVYGSVLVECVKRSEWTEKMTADSSSIAEEMATFKADEARRRQKWARDINGAINFSLLNHMTLGIEVNLQSQKDNWPKVSRHDVQLYIAELERAGDFGDFAAELRDLYKTLDGASKQQARRLKTFKNGSLHEANFGDNSLLLRGDDETLKTVRKDKLRAEERLKSAESRIRKLEDLLHRQSQSSRPQSMAGLGISGSPFERQLSSPAPNFTSALSKARELEPYENDLSYKRTSLNQEPESKNLAQRIVSLEADLIAQKAQSSELEKAAAAKSNAENMLKAQVHEAISTKEDLLSNFEAQHREFEDERRLLNDENKKLKVRVDEMEDELDRVYGNQEYEYRIQSLEEDLDNARKEAATEISKAHEQIDLFRRKSLAEQRRSDQLEHDITSLKGENSLIQENAEKYLAELKSRDRSIIDHQSYLLSALVRISQDAHIPNDFGELVRALGNAVEECVSQRMDSEKTIKALQSQQLLLDGQFKTRDLEIQSLRRDSLLNEEMKTSLLKEVNQHRSDLDTLKAQYDAKVTEIDSLQGQINKFQSDIEENRSRFSDIETRLEVKRSELASLQGSYVRLDTNREAQSSRVDDISSLFYTQMTKLRRLLEQLGFIVTKQDGAMTIQRASRVGGSTTLNDPSTSMKRSVSIPPLSREEVESMIDSKVLHWAKAENLEETQRLHEEFSQAISDFDVDVFNEAIYKRMKEVEHVARKSQRDARSYRDKAHRAQADAYERLTLRSFKEGDLALFLPTRDQATKPWAAFNVGAPHYFLREQESHKLSKRDWLIARISKVEERVVDLSKSINGSKGRNEDDPSVEDENPYELSDGLRWYLLDAAEEKPGAPINVGLGKTTVASVNVDVKGTVRVKKSSDANGATKTLTRSLDSRRSSTNSKKGMASIAAHNVNTAGPIVEGNGSNTELHQQVEDNNTAAATQPLGDASPRHERVEQEQESGVSPSKPLRATPSSPLKPPPEKRKTKAWDSLWSLDLNLESGKAK